MKSGYGKIALHLTLIAGIAALLILCIIYPFLPGEYDNLAMMLSVMAQTFGVFGLLLVPAGGLWLIYELWVQARKRRNLPVKARRYYFALVSVIAASVVAFVITFVAFASGGISFVLLIPVFWLYTLSRLIPGLKLLKDTESRDFNPAPLYLIIVPLVVMLFQVTFAAAATESSRNHAITMSAELIRDIEEYQRLYGRYPGSLLAVWKDYYPSIVGIEKFHYVPDKDAYNLFFEQPRFLFDNIGTREFVVYNKLDEHTMISHTSWILLLRPERLPATQGWYAVHNTTTPHWKYFWFD